MKAIGFMLAGVLLITALCGANTRRAFYFGGVQYDRDGGVHDADDSTYIYSGGILVVDWTDSLLPAGFDSALAFLRNVDVISMNAQNYDRPKKFSCAVADSGSVLNALGRLTPFDLPGLNKTGPWQWDKPLIIQVSDSLSCPYFFRLSQRRWTKIIVGDGAEANKKFVSAYEDLVRRYKREHE